MLHKACGHGGSEQPGTSCHFAPTGSLGWSLLGYQPRCIPDHPYPPQAIQILFRLIFLFPYQSPRPLSLTCRGWNQVLGARAAVEGHDGPPGPMGPPGAHPHFLRHGWLCGQESYCSKSLGLSHPCCHTPTLVLFMLIGQSHSLQPPQDLMQSGAVETFCLMKCAQPSSAPR